MELNSHVNSATIIIIIIHLPTVVFRQSIGVNTRVYIGSDQRRLVLLDSSLALLSRSAVGEGGPSYKCFH